MTSPAPATKPTATKPRFRVPDFDSRQITVGVLAGLAYMLFVAIPTALIPNPVFGREIPPTWWSWPSLIVTTVLVAALTASYIKPRDAVAAEKAELAAREAAGGDTSEEAPSKKGIIGAALTYFAVGCPVCNKLVLLALGYNGALTWFEPFQPVLQLLAVAVMVWAIWQRWTYLDACPTPRAKRRPAGTVDVPVMATGTITLDDVDRT
ncbi:MAG: hypothetical protein ACQERF_02180 [Actinomycetota bacterium]